MFSAMVEAIAEDFVKYVMHLQVVRQEAPPEAEVRNMSYSAPDAPVQGSSGLRAAALAQANQAGEEPPEAIDPEPVNVPVVRSQEEKVGRNDPCFCGSGKKFKHCHGK
jgi:preprotein translocase subunit SecA